MGLFSTVINSCEELGPGFMGELQTKDLDCVMDHYWLSPAGTLFRIDDERAWTLQEDDESPLLPILGHGLKVVPTGLRGAVKPYRKSGVVRLVGGRQGEAVECLVHFKTGMLTGVLCRGPIFSCDRVDD